MKFLSLTLLVLSSCKLIGPAADESASAVASVTVGTPKGIAPDQFDEMVVMVRSADGKEEQVAKAGFKNKVFRRGAKYYFGIRLLKNKKPVASSDDKTPGSKCPYEVKTLSEPQNSVRVKACLYDPVTGRLNSANAPRVIATDGKPADIDLKVCVVRPDGSEDCGKRQNAPAEGNLSGCEKKDPSGRWVSEGGGCKHVRSGLVFSPVARNDAGFIKLTRKSAARHCSRLALDGKLWRLLGLNDRAAVQNDDPAQFLNDGTATTLDFREWYFWVAEDGPPHGVTGNKRQQALIYNAATFTPEYQYQENKFICVRS